MKKVHRLLGSAKFIHGVHLALVGAIIIIVPLTSAQTVHIIQAHHSHIASPKSVQPSPVAHPSTVAAKPKPTPAPPVPAPSPAPQPAPAPVAPKAPSPVPSAAPAAVAAAAAPPGKSVSSLSPAPSSSSPAASSGSPPSAPPPASQPASPSLPPNSSYSSSNWAGYMATSGVYTSVSGTWTVPAVTGNGTDTMADAAWIGIGGVSTQDLIQIGTEDTVDAAGVVSSAIFYELLPSAPIYPTTVTISAGDVMHASISEITPSQWSVSITDQTTGQSFSTTVAYTSSHSSAEWIEEDPSYSSGQLVPFDRFGTVPFSQGFTTTGGVSQTIAASSASDITLVNQAGTPLATPSSLNSTGTAFTVTRK